MKKNLWYQTAYRRNVVDMHITDWNEAFLSQFNPQTYVDMLLRSRSQSAVLYAHSHVGLCHYPTRVGRMHAGLKGRDIFGETLDLCHRHGIAGVGYMSVIHDTWAYDAHAAWRHILPDGTEHAKRHEEGHINRYGICCPNAPYRDYVAALATEICTSYPVDGIRFDMTFWRDVCYCPHCRRRYAKEIGGKLPLVVNWNSPAWVQFQRKREEWLVDFAAHATAAARQARPDVSVEHQSSTFATAWQLGVSADLAPQNDFLQGDFYGGNLQGTFAKKLLHNLTPNRPFGFETSSGIHLGDAITLKSKDLLTAKAFSAVAHDAAFIFIDSIDPVGTLNPRVYDRLADVFKETTLYDGYRGGDLVQDVAIYFGTESKFDPADNNKPVKDAPHSCPHLDTTMGAARTLLQNHIPFGVITRRNLKDLGKFQMVILPNVMMISDAEAAAIRAYVRAGGRIYASRWTSLYHSARGKLKNFLLADVLGVTYRGETAETFTYMGPTAAGTALLPGCSDQYPLSNNGPQVKARAAAGAEVLAQVVLPYSTSGEPQTYASIHNNPPGIVTDLPALIRHRFGKGEAIYTTGLIEQEALEPQQQAFLNIVRSLARRPFTFSAEAPKCVEITAFCQPRARRYTVRLLNFQEELPNLPVTGITVTLNLGKGRKAKRVLLLPGKKPLKFRNAGGSVTFGVPKLETFHMIAVDWA